MSEGNGEGDMAAMANEGECGVDVPRVVAEDQGKIIIPPVINKDKGKAVTTPIENEDQGMDEIVPVMSYGKGTDHIEPVISKGEIKYAVRGSQGTQPQMLDVTEGQNTNDDKVGVSGSQGTQSQKLDVVEGENPKDETRTVSNPASRVWCKQEAEVSQGEEAGNGPRQSESSEDNEDGGVQLNDKHPHVPAVKEGKKPVSGPASGENSQPKSILKKTVRTSDCQKNCRADYDCGCADIYDNTGKKRQQACDRHKLNPYRSVLPLPPKRPLRYVLSE